MSQQSSKTANGVEYRRAPTKWTSGKPGVRKLVRTVWWRYELCKSYSLDFAAEYGMSLQVNPQYNPPTDGALYTISENQLTAFQGFRWDGATGPTLQPKSSVRATLVHDVMCAAIAQGALLRDSRANADLIFREILKADRMPKFRRDIWYLMVDAFG